MPSTIKTILALAIGIAVGVLGRSLLTTEASPAVSVDDSAKTPPESPSAVGNDGQLERLEQDLAFARQRIAELERLVDQAHGAASTTASEKAGKRQAGHVSLAQIEDADAAVSELIARGDLEGLWLLAADLLGMGEPGYDKLLDLMSHFDQLMGQNPDFRGLWRDEEIFVGPFMRALAEHHEDVLRFGMYAMDRDPGSLDDFTSQFVREFSRSIAPILLGYNDREDPALLDQVVQRFGDPAEMSPRDRRGAIGALAQIGGDRALDALVDYYGVSDSADRRRVVAAIAWTRSQRAIELLHAFLNDTDEPQLKAHIEAALRFLED